MVEGSEIDWVLYVNDFVGVVLEVLVFDKVVKVVFDFVKLREDIVVIIVLDYVNGGMILGNYLIQYDLVLLNDFFKYIIKVKRIGVGIEEFFGNNKIDENIKKIVFEYYGIDNLILDEINVIKNVKVGNLNYVLGLIISKRLNIGWIINGYIGEEVVLYVYYLNGYILRGVIDNIEVCDYMVEIFGIDFGSFNESVYILNIDLEEKGYDVFFDISNLINV